MDDVILAGNHIKDIKAVKSFLHEQFKIKDLGNLKYFLGFEIARSKEGLNLSQRKYTLDLLREFGFEQSKEVLTPMESSVKLTKKYSSFIDDKAGYRKLIGKLLYLTNSRLDISYTMQQLSQFLDRPTHKHLKVAHHLLRYLKGTTGLCLFYAIDNKLNLKKFSDSD